jgi:hypothetical protein
MHEKPSMPAPLPLAWKRQMDDGACGLRPFARPAAEDNAVQRRVLAVVVWLSGAALAAVAAVYGGFWPAGESGRTAAPGPFEPDPHAQSRDLDRQLQSTDAHREVLDRLSADLIASRRTLAQAVTVLADSSRQSKPEWLRGVGRRYPGLSEKAAVASALVYFTLFCLHDGDHEDEKSARRLAAEYRACYGVLLTLPERVKGAVIPPCGRVAGLDRAGGS